MALLGFNHMAQTVILPGHCSRTTILSVVGTQGPAGPAGAAGATGATGAAGADGADGTNTPIQVYNDVVPPATPDDPTRAAVFYPVGGGDLQQWDIVTQAWV